MNGMKPLLTAALISTVSISPAMAGGSATHFSKATNHSVQAVGHSAAMSGKAVAGSIAIPLAVVGTVGTISGKASNDLWEIANQPAGTPLPIAKETFTTGQSPKDALFGRRKRR